MRRERSGSVQLPVLPPGPEQVLATVRGQFGQADLDLDPFGGVAALAHGLAGQGEAGVAGQGQGT